MSNRFDDVLLEDFMRTFYGFGRHTAPYWLIGMEEGGHKTFGEIEAKLNGWRDAGRPPLMTLTRQRDRIQKTWGGLIRVVLAARGEGHPRDARHIAIRSSWWAPRANPSMDRRGKATVI